jgi:hypothetical protein
MTDTPISAKRRLDNHTMGLDFNCYTVPQGMKIFNIEKAGDYRLEIIPYRVPVGANNPFADPGQFWYERTFFAHRGIGVKNETHLCLAKTYGVACPVCEEKARINRDPEADKDVGKGLAPKERQLWYVYDHAEPEEGVQLWDISVHLFGKQLDAQTKSADPGDNWEYFADPTQGFTVKVTFIEKQYERTSFYEASAINFKKRPDGFESTIRKLMESIPMGLDDLLKKPSYDFIQGIFNATAPSDAPAGAPPAADSGVPGYTPPPKAAATVVHGAGGTALVINPPALVINPPALAAAQWVLGATVNHPTHGACTVFRVNPDGTATLMDADDTPHKNVPPIGAPTAAPTTAPAPAPTVAVGDNLVLSGVAWRVHKIAADGMAVVINEADDIEKITMDVASAARTTAMVVGSYENKPAPKAMETTAPAATTTVAPAPAGVPAGDVPWDQPW